VFTHILVCCDGSEFSLDAAQTAVAFARRQPCRVTLLYVLDLHAVLPPFIEVWEGAVGPREVAHYQQKARAFVEEPIAKIFHDAGLEYEWRFALGHPVARINEIATKIGADLIVVGSRGLGTWKRFLLGSVSDGVLHHAPCSVLIVRGENAPCGSKGFQQILFASDGSESAGRAGQTAVELAKTFTASLHALNVIMGFGATDPEFILLTTTDLEIAALRSLQQVRDSLQPILAETGVTCTFHQEGGEAGYNILRFAEEHASDLVVLGSRGLGGFDRMLLGSVSTYIAHHASCPVLIVR